MFWALSQLQVVTFSERRCGGPCRIGAAVVFVDLVTPVVVKGQDYVGEGVRTVHIP